MAQLRQNIKDLKKGITNSKLDQFFQDLAELAEFNRSNPAVLSLTKMMKSLGNYIKSTKNKAHKDTIPVLYSIAGHLDLIASSSITDKAQIRKIFITERKKFKELKKQITTSRSVITQSELDDLRAAILAIEWEITNENLKNLENMLKSLLFRLKPKTIVHTFLKIIQASMQHLKVHLGDSQPESISLLQSVFKDFQAILTTPKMGIDQKKQILESNIAKYRQFKYKISVAKKGAVQKNRQPRQPAQAAPAEAPPAEFTSPSFTTGAPEPEQDTDDLPPALSHITDSGPAVSTQASTFTQLPDESDSDGLQPLTNNAKPAFSQSSPESAEPHDVMDDLFSVKESPADEMMDAIHMSNVQKNDPGQQFPMPDMPGQDQGGDIKSFIPEKLEDEPIPEIGSRLDEFFGPEDHAQDTMELPLKEIRPVEAAPQASPTALEHESFAQEKIPTPFDDDVQVANTTPPAGFGRKTTDNSRNIALLKSILIQPHWRTDDKKQKTVNNIVNTLQTEWPDDPEKTKLIEIIRFLIPLDDPLLSPGTDLENIDQNQSADKKQSGLLGSVKKLFT